jgi:hypothetical protein
MLRYREVGTMNRTVSLVLVAVTAACLVVSSSHAAGPRRGPEVEVFVGVGPTYRYPPPPFYAYPPPYYVYPAPPVVYSAPIVVPAPTYVVAPPPPAYWYYCPSSQAYYPNVPACPQAWVPVPVR